MEILDKARWGLILLLTRGTKAWKKAEKTRFMEGTMHCSFCGKEEDEVKKLVAGHKAFICNECVQLCAENLDEE